MSQHQLIPPAAALAPLLDAYRSAQMLGYDPWQFAIEIRCLRGVRLTNTHLRSLLANNLVVQGLEKSEPTEGQRVFVPVANLSVLDTACFVLTEAGVTYAIRGKVTPPNPDSTPRWDDSRRQLLVGSIVIKQYRQPAPNQEKILKVFEEEGWPFRIDDPLPPQHDQDVKRRLHKTINNLNRSHERSLLKFQGGGDGQSVCWRLRRGGPERGRARVARQIAVFDNPFRSALLLTNAMLALPKSKTDAGFFNAPCSIH